MKSKRIGDSPKTFVVIFETGDEVTRGLLDFAVSEQIVDARFSAIGAFQRCTLGYFNWEKKAYQEIPLDEQVEVLSLIGNFAEQDGKPKLHCHVVVGRHNGVANGGHLLKAFVRPTLEVMVVESPDYLGRSFDSASGLALIRL